MSETAPKTPACFPDRRRWVEYLVHCQTQARAARRPFDAAGVFRTTWSFCSDCTAQHAAAMRAAGRCRPNDIKQPATEAAT